MEGDKAHRALLADILDPARRTLSWFAVHLSGWTPWLYTHTRIAETIVTPFLPMKKPVTYTGIRAFALEAYNRFLEDMQSGKVEGWFKSPPDPLGQLQVNRNMLF